MIEPINPQDHEVRGSSPEDFCVFDVGCPTQRLPERSALAEAIHQTFERDAELIESGRHKIGFMICDPETEIDRQARLIVDGEYRRRREAEREGA